MAGYISPQSDVIIEGPGGVGDGMTAVASIENGEVISVQVTDPGSGNICSVQQQSYF